jgi:hypothetical protein
MSVLAAETGDALGCCVFWAALRGRSLRLPGCLTIDQRARPLRLCRAKAQGALAEAIPRLQRSYLGWANAVGRAQPAPVETAPSEWNVKQKVVVFRLSREQ